jgi:hypothetical protein
VNQLPGANYELDKISDLWGGEVKLNQGRKMLVFEAKPSYPSKFASFQGQLFQADINHHYSYRNKDRNLQKNITYDAQTTPPIR